MRSLYSHGDLTWIDFENPTAEEIRELMDERKIPALVAEELLSPTLRPKVDLYPKVLYLILHFPAFRHTHAVNSAQEVDFVLGHDFIVTTRYDTVDPLHKFSKIFEVNSILDRSDIGEHAGYILYYMLKKLYKAVEHELEYLEDELKIIEGKIFEGEERKMVGNLSHVARTILSFKQTLRPHQAILESFERAGTILYGEKFQYHLKGITAEYFRVYTAIRSLGEFMEELRETNNSLLTTKQNEIMKGLTIVAFTTLPLSILASLLQIDTTSRPVVGQPGDFWIILAFMASIALLGIAFFRFKKWL